jgi:DNA repair ATPase RecN
MDQQSLKQIEELLDRKLDEKFTERLAPINARLDKMDTRLTKVEGWEPYFMDIMDYVGRILVDVYDMKIRLDSIDEKLESHDQQLEEHDIKLARIIRLMPDTRAEIYDLNGRVKKLEQKAG